MKLSLLSLSNFSSLETTSRINNETVLEKSHRASTLPWHYINVLLSSSDTWYHYSSWAESAVVKGNKTQQQIGSTAQTPKCFLNTNWNHWIFYLTHKWETNCITAVKTLISYSADLDRVIVPSVIYIIKGLQLQTPAVYSWNHNE